MNIKTFKSSTKATKIIFSTKLKKDTLFNEKKNLFSVKIKSLKDREELRLKSALVVSEFNKLNLKSAIIDNIPNLDAFVEGLILSSYQFLKYKSKPKKNSFTTLYLPKKAFNKKVDRAIKLANATNFTKDIVNTTPNEATPTKVAEISKNVAKSNKLKIKVLKTKDLQKENMNLFLAVSRASAENPTLVKLSHKPKKATKKVLLVGKGLTYDSGGLSLKPSSYMETMKSDKSGASAVLGIMKAVSDLNLNIEVHGYLALTENMIGGDAYKPDDVIKSKSGISVEVRNTDAEGRLVLADTLTYAQQDEKKFDLIIDIATLTGAAVVAVGQYTSIVMGHNEKAKNSFVQAGAKSGELVATLPFNRYLDKLIDSQIADVCNVSSSRYGGALTAGLFLERFITKKNKDKWLHLDIAGPAYIEKNWGYNQYGASGAGVRVVVQKLLELE